MTNLDTRPWRLDAMRLTVGLLHRPQPQVPHLTKREYPDELAELTLFRDWLLWYEGGKKGARPAYRLPVPGDAWTIQREYRRAHPKHPKPPVPPPPPTDHLPTIALDKCWIGPGVCLTWGPVPGSGFDGITVNEATKAEDFAEACVAHGVRYVAYQLIPENDPYMAAWRSACTARNVGFGGWTNVAQQAIGDDGLRKMLDRIEAAGISFFQANIEERWELGGTRFLEDGRVENAQHCHTVFVTEFRKRFPKMPACLQTNFGGFEARDATGAYDPTVGYDREASRIYIDAKFRCQHEDYVNEGTGGPDAGDFVAHNQLRFPRPSSSLIGIYRTARGDFPVSYYLPLLKASGRPGVQWIYDAEQMDVQGWKDIA